MPTFSEHIASWRKDANMSRSELDLALNSRVNTAAGYTAQLERNKMKPPDKATCLAIAEILDVDPETVWDIAAQERLEAFDPDLLSWCEQRVQRAGQAAAGPIVGLLHAAPWTQVLGSDGVVDVEAVLATSLGRIGSDSGDLRSDGILGANHFIEALRTLSIARLPTSVVHECVETFRRTSSATVHAFDTGCRLAFSEARNPAPMTTAMEDFLAATADPPAFVDPNSP